MSYKKIIIYTDGGARGNPGQAAIGVVIYDKSGKIVKEISECIGEKTNNQAEYQALITALHAAKKIGANELECYLDSELVVRQLKREYKVRDKELAPLFMRVWNLAQEFKKVRFHHVTRERNTAADALVNKALDAKR